MLRAAIEALARIATPPRALVGFDGFIDVICTAVSGRASMEPGDYTTFTGIGQFADRVAASAGRSTNIELVVHEERFGGNGPLLAGGLAALGVETTFVGCVGDDAGAGVHPVFQPFARRCARVVPIARPSRTECLEFTDGKVMFNKVFAEGHEHGSMQGVRWGDVVHACGGVAALRGLVASCSLVAIVNWSIMAGVEDIWAGMTADVLTHIPPAAPGWGTPRRVLVDISDPAKRTRDDVRRAMHALGALHQACPVTLGLNLSEAEQVCAALLGDVAARATLALPLAGRSQSLARDILGALNVECVVVHPREGAAGACTRTGKVETCWVDGPFTPTPTLSTGAGDHFNAGLGLGLMLDLPLADALALGAATSGAYVRTGVSPGVPQVEPLL
jgi:fructose-1-phosphate kinase PfkB-like protein